MPFIASDIFLILLQGYTTLLVSQIEVKAFLKSSMKLQKRHISVTVESQTGRCVTIQKIKFLMCLIKLAGQASLLVLLKVSRSRNKIVELQILPKTKFVRSFFGRICGSTILFRDLLTFNQYMLLKKTVCDYTVVETCFLKKKG